MLAPYIQILRQTLQVDHPSRKPEEKEKLEDLIFERVFDEAEKFIKDSLDEKHRESFIKDLDKATQKDDVEQMMRLMVRGLMKIPHSQYKLHARMEAMISQVTAKLK